MKKVWTLKNEGSSVLNYIHIQKAMREELGIDMAACQILGSCNPPLAHRALQTEPGIGLLLPRSMMVREEADHEVSIGILGAQAMVQVTSNEGVASVAEEAGERLRRVQRALASVA